MEKRIIRIDASILKNSACNRCLYLKLMKGYRDSRSAACIEFGSAFHLFTKLHVLNPFNMRSNLQEAMRYFRETTFVPDKRIKYYTEGKLASVCSSWSIWNEKQTWDILRCPTMGPVVEFKFKFKIYEDDYCIILLCGTIDKLVTHITSKILCIGDYKTTSKWDLEEYLSQYDLSGQLAIYTKALHHYIDISTPDSVLYSFRGKTTGAFIEGIFLSAAEVDFRLSNMRLDHQMQLEELDFLLQKHCENISRIAQEDKLPRRDGILNGACTYCSFNVACPSEDSRAFESIMERNFIKKSYDPLNFHGEECVAV